MQDGLRKVRPLPEVVDAITGRHNPQNAGDGYGHDFCGMPQGSTKGFGTHTFTLLHLPGPSPYSPQGVANASMPTFQARDGTVATSGKQAS